MLKLRSKGEYGEYTKKRVTNIRVIQPCAVEIFKHVIHYSACALPLPLFLPAKSVFEIAVISQTFDDPYSCNLERSDQITTVGRGFIPHICELTAIVLTTNSILRHYNIPI